MSQYRIFASIYDVAPERLHQLLGGVIGELSFRSRVAGYQMFHESARMALSVETTDDHRPQYTLSGKIHGDQEVAAGIAEKIAHCLKEADVLYLLDYVEVDEEGDEIGDEVSLSHPDFDARYAARRQGG